MVGDAVRCTLRMNECPYDKNISIKNILILDIQISKVYGNQGGNTGKCSSLLGMGFFYDIGIFVPCIIKTFREDAHSREEEVCRKAAVPGTGKGRGTFLFIISGNFVCMVNDSIVYGRKEED